MSFLVPSYVDVVVPGEAPPVFRPLLPRVSRLLAASPVDMVLRAIPIWVLAICASVSGTMPRGTTRPRGLVSAMKLPLATVGAAEQTLVTLMLLLPSVPMASGLLLLSTGANATWLVGMLHMDASLGGLQGCAVSLGPLFRCSALAQPPRLVSDAMPPPRENLPAMPQELPLLVVVVPNIIKFRVLVVSLSVPAILLVAPVAAVPLKHRSRPLAHLGTRLTELLPSVVMQMLWVLTRTCCLIPMFPVLSVRVQTLVTTLDLGKPVELTAMAVDVVVAEFVAEAVADAVSGPLLYVASSVRVSRATRECRGWATGGFPARLLEHGGMCNLHFGWGYGMSG